MNLKITPTMRGRVQVRLAERLGAGEVVDRHVVIAELFGSVAVRSAPVEVPVAVPVGFVVEVLAPPVPTSPTPIVEVGDVVSIADAAVMLGVKPSTVAAYRSPSRGKLVPAGDGVTLTSVNALLAGRMAA